MPGVEALRALLGLIPHPTEGGYFVETYRSAERLPAGRAVSTAICYLLTPDTFSALRGRPAGAPANGTASDSERDPDTARVQPSHLRR
jgi:hypothetical protein